jgi:hypothetical protein
MASSDVPDGGEAFTDEELLAGVPGLDDVQQQAPVAFEATASSANVRLVPVVVNGSAMLPVIPWVPNGGAEQWGLLLDTMGSNLTKEDGQSVLAVFCASRSLSVLSTRFEGPAFAAAQRVKREVEDGTRGTAGPCFNPNEDNVNFQDNDQATRDGRWLLVWQQMARHAKASGGKVIQLLDKSMGLSDMQKAEASFAGDLGVCVAQEALSSSIALVPVTPRAIQQSVSGGQIAPARSKACEVVTVCIEGDISEFDEARVHKLRRMLATMLADEMSPDHIRVRPMPTAKMLAARIGTGRCRVRVEVDTAGFAEFSTDESSSSSGADGSEESSEDRLERQIERDVEHAIHSKYWPSVEVKDIDIVFIGPGSVLLVFILPAPAAHVLLQLNRLRPPPKPLTDEGIRCCKLGDSVARLDDEPDIEDRVRSLFGAAVLAAERAAREGLDAEREAARAAQGQGQPAASISTHQDVRGMGGGSFEDPRILRP